MRKKEIEELERQIRDIKDQQKEYGKSLWEAKKHLGFKYIPPMFMGCCGETITPKPTLSEKLDLLLASLGLEIVGVPGNVVCRKIEKVKK